MPAETSDSAWLEEIVARFEDAWQHGERRRIEDHLPTQADLRRAALVELAHVELEFRLEAGEPARAEDYFKRFPELANDGAAAASLLGAEYVLRRRARPSLKPGNSLLAARLPTVGWPPADGGAASDGAPPSGEPTPLPSVLTPMRKPAAPAEPGRYRALAPHARGGLGEVLVAEDAQLGRRVALKRIQPRWRHDAEARRRFLLEAEVTGRLEHPGVVPVYSLTEDADGELCYAMRFVEGETLQQAIRRYHAAPGPLELRQLLSRFVAVCNAVGYAHSRGVLHRDLKPANIMLGKYGETLLVDWGLAKAIQRSEEARTSGEQTLVTTEPASGDGTRLGQVVGTPAYMAPEQAAGAWDSISSAADVYALGATLYCLLTGRAPFDDPDPRQVLARVQRGDFPLPRAVRADVPRALEAVCLKAMARRSEGRYGSALELAGDVERWLADEPVTAHPEPLPVRLRRQARRHPATLAATVALLLAGLVGLGLGLAAVRAEQQRTAGERDRAEANAAEAQRQRGRSEAVNKFLLDDLLAQAAPENNARQKKVTVEDVLAKAAAKVEKSFADQPDVEADVRRAVGLTYHKLGVFEQAQPQLERVLALRRRQQGPDHVDTMDAANELALLLQDQGKYKEALQLFRQNLEDHRRVSGPDHPDTLTAVNNLTALLLEQGKVAEAEPLLRRNLEACRRVLGDEHTLTLSALNNLVVVLINQKKAAEAEPLARLSAEVSRRVRGPEHPETLGAVNNLAGVLYTQRKMTEAEPLLRENLEGNRRVLGPEHPVTLTALNNVARVLHAQGRLAEAERLCRQTLEARRRLLGPDHPDSLATVNNLAQVLQDQGKPAEALPLFRQNLEAYRQLLGAEHPNTLAAGVSLARLLREQETLQEALPLVRRTLEGYRRVLGAEHPDTLAVIIELAGLLQEQGQPAEAERLAREALTGGRKVLPAGDPTLTDSLTLLGGMLSETGRADEAEPLLREALTGRRTESPTGRRRVARTESHLGACLAAEQKFAEAEPLLLGSYQALAQAPGTPEAERRRARQRLVKLYEAWGNPAEAAKWKAEHDQQAKPSTPKAP
jgi:tetratricopeptide (TPR) repeat protein/tRNA A-37 threonylcarbamoyl transferase component Bud32